MTGLCKQITLNRLAMLIDEGREADHSPTFIPPSEEDVFFQASVRARKSSKERLFKILLGMYFPKNSKLSSSVLSFFISAIDKLPASGTLYVSSPMLTLSVLTSLLCPSV